MVRRRLEPQQLNAVGTSTDADRSTYYSPELPPMRPSAPPRLLACGLAIQIAYLSFSGEWEKYIRRFVATVQHLVTLPIAVWVR